MRDVSIDDLINKYSINDGVITHKHNVVCGNGRVIKKAGEIAGCYSGPRAKDGGQIQVGGTGFSAARAAYMLYNNCNIPNHVRVNFVDGNSLNLKKENLTLVDGFDHNRRPKPSGLPVGVFIVKPRHWMPKTTIRYCACVRIKRGGEHKEIYGPYRISVSDAKSDYAKMIARYRIFSDSQTTI